MTDDATNRYLTGNFAPVDHELSAADLRVTGTVPRGGFSSRCPFTPTASLVGRRARVRGRRAPRRGGSVRRARPGRRGDDASAFALPEFPGVAHSYLSRALRTVPARSPPGAAACRRRPCRVSVAAVTATTMSLVVVFLPVALITGIAGQWFKPFALTIAGSVAVSLFVSFSPDPMLSAYWPDPHRPRGRVHRRWMSRPAP